MRTIAGVVAALVLFLVGASVRAEDAVAPTFDNVPVKSNELPDGVRIVDGERCASKAAHEVFLDPGYRGSLDCPPDRKACQSFEGPGGGGGSVLVFEYAGAVPGFMQRVLAKSLWGDDGRTAERPDDYVAQGKLLWVFSFPYGDATGEWVKERLRKKFHVAAKRTRPDHEELRRRVQELAGKRDCKGGLAALAAAPFDRSDWSGGAYLEGECSMGERDWPRAEAAYRRARELHDGFIDPMNVNIAWAALDGLGNALVAESKFADAAKVLEQSLAEGSVLRLENDETPHTAYALACAYVGLGKWDDALRELTDAVDGNPRWLKPALTSDALDAARKRKEFRVLLELDPPTPAPPPPKSPAPPSEAAAPITFDALLLKPADLPTGWSLVEGVRCVSTSAARFFVSPDPGKISGTNLIPYVPPTRKSCQSIVRPDGTAGSVLLFEFGDEKNRDYARSFLAGYCWGDDKRPSNHDPEEIFVEGPRLWVFSFPRGDVACEWVKERLRKRFRIPVPRTRLDILPSVRHLFSSYSKSDFDRGLRLFDARAARFADSSSGWYGRAECCFEKKDYPGAETAYRYALALHDALVDPLADEFAWLTLDGLGTSLLMERKLEEACKTLQRAKTFAADHPVGEDKDTSGSTYNLACALALLKRFDESLVELKAAIATKPDWKDSARDDSDFAEARKRPDFQALLAK